jgi:hypothetical protein
MVRGPLDKRSVHVANGGPTIRQGAPGTKDHGRTKYQEPDTKDLQRFDTLRLVHDTRD